MFSRLLFDGIMIDFLEKTSTESKISVLFLQSRTKINDIGNFIKSERGYIDVISYVPKGKYKSIDVSYFSDDVIGRVKIKIGRFVSKFLSKETISEYLISDKDIEIFVNLFKSYFSRDESKLKIVSGNEILHWYLEENYYTPNFNKYGSLWNSCMRQHERNKFMKIYSQNSDIKMLIFLNDDGKLRSRALLWENAIDNDGNRYKVMDRIYSVYDHDVNFFKDWAIKNGYIHKLDQNSKSERYFVGERGNLKLNLYVNLENYQFNYYPYFDTFKYFDPKNGRFNNNDFANFKYILVQSNGALFPDEVCDEVEAEFDDV